jgi:hypothetical protein
MDGTLDFDFYKGFSWVPLYLLKSTLSCNFKLGEMSLSFLKMEKSTFQIFVKINFSTLNNIVAPTFMGRIDG